MKYIITHVDNHLISAHYENDKCIALRVYEKDSLMGNIYIGRVENVVKNMNNAFVGIQKGVNCFYSLVDNKNHIFLKKENDGRFNQGDAVLVQVCKEPQKTKPATLTSKIELTGKYLVLSTNIKGVYISSKVKTNEHVKQLQKVLFSYFIGLQNEFENITHYGFILRSNSIYASENEILEEAEKQTTQFHDILKKGVYGKALTCLYQAVPAYITEIRDIPTENLEEIITDTLEIQENLMKFLTAADYAKVRLYQDSMLALYKLYDIEKQICRALRPKIWLKCGGFIVIQQTEALVSIDVNSAKCISKKHGEKALEDTIFKVNMEAATEIALQLRLRNLSGIIIVDFINMKEPFHYEQLIEALKAHFKKDKVTTNFVDITQLGLVEITRKRAGKTLKEIYEDYHIE